MPRSKSRSYSATWRAVNILASSPEDAAEQAIQRLRRSSKIALEIRLLGPRQPRERLIVLPFAGPRIAPPDVRLTDSLLQSLISNSLFDSAMWRVWHDDSDNLYLTYKHSESWRHYRVVVDKLRIVNPTRRALRRYAFEVEGISSHLRYPARAIADVVRREFRVHGPMRGDGGVVRERGKR